MNPQAQIIGEHRRMSSAAGAVLIVEDEVGLAELFEIWLEPAHDVDVVTQGSDALEILGPHIDVVVLDWRMPEVSGEDILEHIRSEELDCGIAVVTGLDPRTGDIDDDVDAVLRKPVQREDLLAIVDSMIGDSDT